MSEREVLCPYCGNPAQFVDSSVIFGTSYGMIWHCQPCDARVGTRRGTTVPLGTLADSELRRARREVHAVFDPIWQGGNVLRHRAYWWLAGQMGIPGKECHVALFDLERCAAAVEACEARTT